MNSIVQTNYKTKKMSILRLPRFSGEKSGHIG